jgi:hypothetical protein
MIMTNNQDAGAATILSPPYIPWKSFGNYIAALKNTTVPHTLDNTVRPSNMAGGLWRQLTSAMQFLGLINGSKVAQESLGRLVKAHGSPEWKGAVSAYVLPAYAKIIGELPIASATAGQLEKCFKEEGHVQGQMLEKSMRFYIHALKEAGVKYSSYFTTRREKSIRKTAGTGKGNPKKKDEPTVAGNGESEHPTAANKSPPAQGAEDSSIPAGLIEQRLFFKGKPTGCIRVPADLTVEDCKVIELTLAVLKAYAEQGATAPSN